MVGMVGTCWRNLSSTHGREAHRHKQGMHFAPHTKGYIVGHASNSLAMKPEAGNGDEGH